MQVMLRPAHPAEASALSELAGLTLTADDVATGRVVVAAVNGRLVGFYSVDGAPPDGELGNLWVEPGAIGIGLDRRLWKHAVGTARAAGFTTLHIESDPHTEGFYLAMGAERVDERPSASDPGRALLRFPLT